MINVKKCRVLPFSAVFMEWRSLSPHTTVISASEVVDTRIREMIQKFNRHSELKIL